MNGVTVRTCAKVNLCLRVLGRRDDGWHEVQTVLQTIGLWDTIHLAPPAAPGRISLTVAGADIPADETNLCWRAAELLAPRAGSPGVAMHLEKSIPAAAGLGGGSSDAAAVLLALTRLWGLDVSLQELRELAAQLGSDVPFFLDGGCALARGRGEKLTPLPEVAAWLVVVVPERRLSTAQAYAALGRGAASGRCCALTRAAQRAVDAVKSADPAGLAKVLHNDFEKLRMAPIKESLRAKEELLEAGCLGAGLSGSGPAVFGIAPDRSAAEQVVRRLQERWSWVRAAPTVPAGQGIVMQERREVSP